MDPLDYSMPAEWAPHSRTWMMWPYNLNTWRKTISDDIPARASFIGIVSAIAEFEPVFVGALPQFFDEVQNIFSSHENVTVIAMESNDIWVRDTGPTFVLNKTTGALGGISWTFNCWGGMGIVDGVNYLPWDKDNQVSDIILDYNRLSTDSRASTQLVMEGGSFHVDGEGTLITTEECLLNENRNPGMSKEAIETELKTRLGVEKVIWLPRGLVADEDTNGHVDNFCCFAAPGHVLLAWSDDENDEQYSRSKEALHILENCLDARGRRFTITKLPCPREPLHYTEEECSGMTLWGHHTSRQPGQRLAASYVNFYIANGGVIVPGFGVPEADEAAAAVLRGVFPQHRVVQVQTREILLGGGNIHCITQQQPAAAAATRISS